MKVLDYIILTLLSDVVFKLTRESLVLDYIILTLLSDKNSKDIQLFKVLDYIILTLLSDVRNAPKRRKKSPRLYYSYTTLRQVSLQKRDPCLKIMPTII